MVTMRIICPIFWVQNAFQTYVDKSHIHAPHIGGPSDDSSDDPSDKARREGLVTPLGKTWDFNHDNGLAPSRDLDDGDPVWITPNLLIALNAFRAAGNEEPIALEAPSNGWMGRLPADLLGRASMTTSVADILTWTHIPAGLGAEPWSQLDQGRVPEFRAARRDLATLRHDLAGAPADSAITVSAHIPGIIEEWCVIVHDGEAVASCGYCVHLDADDGHGIATIFDGATFHEEYKGLVERTAERAARLGGLGNASVIVGFVPAAAKNECTPRHSHGISASPTNATANGPAAKLANEPASEFAGKATDRPSDNRAGEPAAYVIEADPVWCTTPYPFDSDAEIQGFLEAIADSRLARDADGTYRHPDGRPAAAANVYSPDPWMLRLNHRRYLGFR